jgi:hypothetical protein
LTDQSVGGIQKVSVGAEIVKIGCPAPVLDTGFQMLDGPWLSPSSDARSDDPPPLTKGRLKRRFCRIQHPASLLSKIDSQMRMPCGKQTFYDPDRGYFGKRLSKYVMSHRHMIRRR